MPKIWVLRGIKKGILTNEFPKKKPTAEEIPGRAVPPVATTNSDWVSGEKVCPTGAIQSAPERRIDMGKCIYCQRCAGSGFDFDVSNKGRVKALQANVNDNNAAEVVAKRLRIFKRSFHILMIDVGSCNACNLEVLNLSNPYYDLTRFGIFFTNSPKHADALIVVGALNRAMVDVLKRTYESMPEPKLVISAGACAISGGIFRGTESFVSPIQDVLPVDVVIPGCPPTPIQILEGLLLAVGKIDKEAVLH
jgi:Ni,Fe-hydrogenase III small subunit